MFIAVDFDGTIVQHKFPEIGPAVPGAVEWLQKLQRAGARLILWTMRSDGERGRFLTDAYQWCRDNDIIIDFVNENPQDWTRSPKAYAHVYVDDSAFGCPLIPPAETNGKPMVDWDVVGPALMRALQQRSKE